MTETNKMVEKIIKSMNTGYELSVRIANLPHTITGEMMDARNILKDLIKKEKINDALYLINKNKIEITNVRFPKYGNTIVMYVLFDFND